MRSVFVFALFASALAASCTGSIGGVPFDLTPLRNDMADYSTSLYSPDNEYNRTYVYFFVSLVIALFTISAEIQFQFLEMLKVVISVRRLCIRLREERPLLPRSLLLCIFFLSMVHTTPLALA